MYKQKHKQLTLPNMSLW